MSQPKASIKVEIAGEEYTLRTNAGEEYTRRCAALVNDRMEEIRSGSGLDRLKAAIMAALSLSDDILQQRAEIEDLRNAVESEADTLVERLDRSLADA